MSKYYLVTVREIVRTTYRVPAKDEDEARAKVEDRQPNDGIEMVSEEYWDMDFIEEVEEDK